MPARLFLTRSLRDSCRMPATQRRSPITNGFLKGLSLFGESQNGMDRNSEPAPPAPNGNHAIPPWLPRSTDCHLIIGVRMPNDGAVWLKSESVRILSIRLKRQVSMFITGAKEIRRWISFSPAKVGSPPLK